MQTNVFEHDLMTENSVWDCYLIMFYYILKNMVSYYRAHAGGAQFKATLLTERDKQEHQYQNSTL